MPRKFYRKQDGDMIKTIVTNSEFLKVGSPNAYVNQNGMPNAGAVHYNTQTQSLQVFDGMVWNTVSNSATIDLSDRAKAILGWAEQKMVEEQRIQQMAETNPALKDAVEALNRAREQVQIVAALVQQ